MLLTPMNATDGTVVILSSLRWMRWVLVLAGFYHISLGALMIGWPNLPFLWAQMETPRYPEIWQYLGMLIGVFGVGCLTAATNPFRHWGIVLVGLLGKVLGAIGIIQAMSTERLSWPAGIVCLAHEVIWWGPFLAVLWRVIRARSIAM